MFRMEWGEGGKVEWGDLGGGNVGWGESVRGGAGRTTSCPDTGRLGVITRGRPYKVTQVVNTE